MIYHFRTLHAVVKIVATQIWQVTDWFANDTNLGTNAGSWYIEWTGAAGCWNTVLKHRKHASFNKSVIFGFPSNNVSIIGVDNITWKSNGTTPRSIRANTCWSVPLAREPKVTAASSLILSPILSDESPRSCNKRGTTPWAITDPFCLLLPITEFFKHLEIIKRDLLT